MVKPEFLVTKRVRWDKWTKKKQGYPVFLRIKLPGQPQYFEPTEVYIANESQWDQKAQKIKAHPNKVFLNKILDDQKNDYETRLIEQAAKNRKLTRATAERKEITSFFEYMKGIVSRKKATTEIGRIERYFKREPSVHEIDYEWLRKYEKNQKEIWEDAPETIKGTFKVLRKVTNVAVAEGYIPKMLIGKGAYPCPLGGSDDPIFLIEEEREAIYKAWANGEITDPGLYRSLTYFLLACYSGLRFGDLEIFDIKTKVIGDQIVLRARKNNKRVSYPIGDSLKAILAVIKQIGPINQDYDLYNNKNLKTLQKFFKQEKYGIDKEWGRSHVGRHSFGRLMAEKDVTPDDCAYFMGVSKATVLIYFHTSGKIVADRNQHLRAV